MTTVDVGQPTEAPNAADAGRYDAFVSYSRHDGSFAVDELVTELRAADKEIWLDLDISGGAKWLDRVNRGIEACKSLIFVVTHHSVASEACREELDDAVALNKLIIPVIHEDVAEEEMPKALSECEWVFLRDGDDHAAGIKKLLEALEADLEWRDQHTRLAGRAREWLDSERNSSYLLRGADLRNADAWLAQHEGHREAPTREQVEYITRSHQAAGRRLYTLIGALAIGLVIALGLSIFALIQRSTAVHQSHVAQSRDLAAQAVSYGDIPLSSLAALEAYKLSPTFAARSAILQVADNHQVGAPMSGGAGAVEQAALSPDGKTIASATFGETVQLWDVATHRRILPDLAGHTDRVQSVGFSSDGQTLASGSYDKTIRFWRVTDHQPIGPPITAGTDSIEAVAFSPDGRLLASGSDDQTVRLWSVRTHHEVGQPLLGHTHAVETVAFSPNGRVLASGSVDNTIRLWDVAQRTPIGRPLKATAAGVKSLAFSPDGRTLAAGYLDHNVRLWDVATGRQIGAPFTGNTNFVLGVAFSPDGKTLASAGYDTLIRLWSVATHQPIGQALAGNSDYVNSIDFTRDGNRLVSGGGDGTVRVWTVASSRQIGAPLLGHTNYVNAVGFSHDGKVLASAGDDHTIRFWDVAKHQPLSAIPFPVDSITSLAFAPDGKTLATAQTSSAGATIAFWDIASGRLRSRPLIVVSSADARQGRGLTTITYSPNGKLLAYVTFQGVGLIRTSDGASITRQQLMPGLLTVSFSPDSSELATAGPDDNVLIYRTATQRPAATLPQTAVPVHAVAWSPDGNTLASGSGDNAVRLWDVASGKQISIDLTGHTGEINSLSFSPDGGTLASASDDGTIRLWDVAARRALGGPLTGHTRPVADAVFSPDGRTLASGSADETVRLWTTAPIGTYIHQLCGYIDLSQAPQLWRQAALSVPYQPPC